MKVKNTIVTMSAFVALSLVGCTASDPENGLDINEPVNEIVGPDSPENPLNTHYLKEVFLLYPNSSYCLFMPFSTEIEYVIGTTRPLQLTECYIYPSQCRYIYTFEYSADNEYPASISVSKETYSSYSGQYTLTEQSRIYDIVFEKGLMRSCKYGVKTIINDGDETEPVLDEHKMEYAYTDNHLTTIRRDDETFVQEWNAEGDLVKISSPVYGESTIEYTQVVNRYGQWDPFIPLIGTIQVFGWFGRTPTHFPNFIMNTDTAGESNTFQYNYYINRETGVITESSVNTQFASETFNYSYMTYKN